MRDLFLLLSSIDVGAEPALEPQEMANRLKRRRPQRRPRRQKFDLVDKVAKLVFLHFFFFFSFLAASPSARIRDRGNSVRGTAEQETAVSSLFSHSDPALSLLSLSHLHNS